MSASRSSSFLLSLHTEAPRRFARGLARAAENGKDVLCVLELRARFDEENNINYSEMLQDAGCTVIYGLPG